MFTIYQITNKLTQESYIGFTSRTPEKRWNEHFCAAHKRKTHFHCAISKYGRDSFVCSILEQGWNREIGLEIREPYWISVLKSEYNKTSGGEGQSLGYSPSEVSRKKSSMAHKTSPHAIKQRKTLHTSLIGIPRSLDFKKKISVAMLGNKNSTSQDRSYMKTPEYRAVMRAAKRKIS
jgi:group I intron endonuclease